MVERFFFFQFVHMDLEEKSHNVIQRLRILIDRKKKKKNINNKKWLLTKPKSIRFLGHHNKQHHSAARFYAIQKKVIERPPLRTRFEHSSSKFTYSSDLITRAYVDRKLIAGRYDLVIIWTRSFFIVCKAFDVAVWRVWSCKQTNYRLMSIALKDIFVRVPLMNFFFWFSL